MTNGPSAEPTTPLTGHDAGEGWHLGLRRNRVVPLCGVAIAVVLCGYAVALAVQGRVLAAAGCALVAVATGLMPWWRSGSRRTPYLHPDAGGLVLPLDPMSVPAVISLLVLGLLALGVVVALAVGAGSANLVGRALGLLLASGGALLFLLGAYGGLRGRSRPDRCVLLTPQAVILRSERRPVRVPWPAVQAVRPHWTSWRRGWFRFDDVVRNWLTIDADAGSVDGHTALSVLARCSAPTVDAEQLACDPLVALAVLRHYLAHTEDRAELGSAAALDRVAILAAATSRALP